MIDIIAAAIAALASGYVTGRKDTRADLLADALRWRAIDTLRQSSEMARVTIWNDDKAGRSMVTFKDSHLRDDDFRAASIDIALAQAINKVAQAINKVAHHDR